jgi:hypothetical protein
MVIPTMAASKFSVVPIKRDRTFFEGVYSTVTDFAKLRG